MECQSSDCDNQSVQIVCVNKFNQFQLLIDDFQNIFLQENVRDREIVVLSVFGASRTGKSFLLNILLCYLNHRYKNGDSSSNWLLDDNELVSGFSVASGKSKCTKGIWMWSEIFCSDLPDGRKIAIILLDTQSIFDRDSTQYENDFLFGLTSLLSSIQVYNVQHLIRGNDLMHLQLDKYIAGNEDAVKLFQKLVFTVRDSNPTGRDSFVADSGRQYLENIMKKDNFDFNGLQKTKELILSKYDNIDCYLLPQPHVMISMKNEFKISYMEESFKNSVKILAENLLAPQNLIVKQINGQSIRAGDFVSLMDSYLNDIKPHEFLKAKEKILIEKTTDKMIEEFTKRMKQIVDHTVPVKDYTEFHCAERDHILRTLKVQHNITQTVEEDLNRRLNEISENLFSKLNIKGDAFANDDILQAKTHYSKIMGLIFDDNTINREELKAEHEIQLKKILEKFKKKHNSSESEQKLRDEIEAAFLEILQGISKNKKDVRQNLAVDFTKLLSEYAKCMDEIIMSETFKKISEIVKRHDEVQTDLIEKMISVDKYVDDGALLTEYIEKFKASTNANILSNIVNFEERLEKIQECSPSEMKVVAKNLSSMAKVNNSKGKRKKSHITEKDQPIYNITIHNTGPQQQNTTIKRDINFRLSLFNGMSL